MGGIIFVVKLLKKKKGGGERFGGKEGYNVLDDGQK